MLNPPLPAVTLAEPASLSPARLFIAFSKIALTGFGGVMPFAYRALVEQYRWLSADEFARYLALSQVLPGPTICNIALMIGKRYAGIAGALAAMAGLIIAPFLLVIALGVAYQHFGTLAIVQDALTGMTAVAAGLVLATAIKMAMLLFGKADNTGKMAKTDKTGDTGEIGSPGKIKLLSRHATLQAVLMALAFAGLALLKWRLIVVFVLLALPGSIVAYFLKDKNG
ncbi:chromate transporter [Undibacterium sp. CY18W]|uniref:Chromate transporter n=1 Tax=Undibacterium hunanense TaxID=2762292 RepID=A0ABR6ZTB0_9BURK|nr:chromate transporter [Undibacterium hunanense]MBC3919102.1 chromate transporter [Undibacterium hunanense]